MAAAFRSHAAVDLDGSVRLGVASDAALRSQTDYSAESPHSLAEFVIVDSAECMTFAVRSTAERGQFARNLHFAERYFLEARDYAPEWSEPTEHSPEADDRQCASSVQVPAVATTGQPSLARHGQQPPDVKSADLPLKS